MGRHSKEIEPTAQGAPVGRFLRMLQEVSGKTWRELGAASHISHTTLSQGADGRLAGRWYTVDVWLRAFYSGAGTERVAGLSLEEALAHAHKLWRHCRECARLGKLPVDRDIEVVVPSQPDVAGPTFSAFGRSIVMEVRQIGRATGTAVGSPVPTQSTGTGDRRIEVENLHEARSTQEFVAAIERARVEMGLAWSDIVRVLFEKEPAHGGAAAMIGEVPRGM